MSKFSDFPHFILTAFFDELIESSEYIGTFNSYLRWGNRGLVIVTGGTGRGGPPPYFYTVDDEGRYTCHRFRALSHEGNIFKFAYTELISTFTDAASAFDAGSAVYIRKDSSLHTFINDNSAYDDYVHVDKDFLYFGEIYPTNDGYYNVIFRGMKDYVMDALPEHSRTENLTEFVNVYFDQVHQQIYNLQKSILSLHDPKETRLQYLAYLADTYGIYLDDDFIEYMGDLPAREWVDAMIYFLKRKGTYAAVYAIWKTLLSGTANKLRVFEMWHEKGLTGVPKGNFYEIPYEGYYSITPSGCVEAEYYGAVAPYGYPDWQGDGTTVVYTVSAGLLGLWDFNDGIGATATDNSGYGNDGTLEGSMSNENWVRGISSFGLTFDGVDNRVDCGNSAPLDTLGSTDFSISTWMKSGSTINSNGVLFSKYQDASNRIELKSYGTNNRVRLEVVKGGTSVTSNFSTSSTVFDQTRHHIILTVDRGTDLASLYIDNVKDATDINISTLPSDCTNTGNVSWGALPDGTLPYLGAEDECRVYEKALDEKERTLLYEHPGEPPSNLVLTPHYRVEIDLTCEPLGSTFIMNESTINNLIDGWNYTKPVSKYIHYSELISPLSDFSEDYVSLYGESYNAFLKTGFTGSAFTSAGRGLDNVVGGYEQQSASTTWNIAHNLNSENVIVQCFDADDSLIIPSVQIIDSSDVVAVEFDEAVRGTAFATTSDTLLWGYTHTLNETTPSATWGINHGLGQKEQLVQFYNSSDERMFPSSVELTDSNNITVTWTSETSGTAIVRKADTIVTDYVSSPSTTWIMDRDGESAGVIAQFFDTNDEQMYPVSYVLTSDTEVTAVFSEATSGYAALDSIPRDWSQETIMSSINYWKVGTGGSHTYNPISNNDVDTMAVSGSDFNIRFGDNYYFDDNYWYLDFTVPEQSDDLIITEVGIFNTEDYIQFYSFASPLFVPAGVELKYHFRISKIPI